MRSTRGSVSDWPDTHAGTHRHPELKPIPSETAEKVRSRIRRPGSRRVICLDGSSEARRTAAWAPPVAVDAIAAGEIDFFSGLVEKGSYARALGCCFSSGR